MFPFFDLFLVESINVKIASHIDKLPRQETQQRNLRLFLFSLDKDREKTKIF